VEAEASTEVVGSAAAHPAAEARAPRVALMEARLLEAGSTAVTVAQVRIVAEPMVARVAHTPTEAATAAMALRQLVAAPTTRPRATPAILAGTAPSAIPPPRRLMDQAPTLAPAAALRPRQARAA
jgi:hypothetical protein